MAPRRRGFVVFIVSALGYGPSSTSTASASSTFKDLRHPCNILFQGGPARVTRGHQPSAARLFCFPARPAVEAQRGRPKAAALPPRRRQRRPRGERPPEAKGGGARREGTTPLSRPRGLAELRIWESRHAPAVCLYCQFYPWRGYRK